MTANEINAFARRVNLDKEMAGKKILIKREDGKYLTRNRRTGETDWTDDRELAYIYDYDEDRVGTQLEEVERRYNAKWSPEIYA